MRHCGLGGEYERGEKDREEDNGGRGGEKQNRGEGRDLRSSIQLFLRSQAPIHILPSYMSQ